jgi:hypothetical protein
MSGNRTGVGGGITDSPRMLDTASGAAGFGGAFLLLPVLAFTVSGKATVPMGYLPACTNAVRKVGETLVGAKKGILDGDGGARPGPRNRRQTPAATGPGLPLSGERRGVFQRPTMWQDLRP